MNSPQQPYTLKIDFSWMIFRNPQIVDILYILVVIRSPHKSSYTKPVGWTRWISGTISTDVTYPLHILIYIPNCYDVTTSSTNRIAGFHAVLVLYSDHWPIDHGRQPNITTESRQLSIRCNIRSAALPGAVRKFDVIKTS